MLCLHGRRHCENTDMIVLTSVSTFDSKFFLCLIDMRCTSEYTDYLMMLKSHVLLIKTYLEIPFNVVELK